jgi:hypothetical protein
VHQVIDYHVQTFTRRYPDEPGWKVKNERSYVDPGIRRNQYGEKRLAVKVPGMEGCRHPVSDGYCAVGVISSKPQAEGQMPQGIPYPSGKFIRLPGSYYRVGVV